MTQLRAIADALLAALNAPGKPAECPKAKFWVGLQFESKDLPVRQVGWMDESVERAGSEYSPLVQRRVTFVIQDLIAGTGRLGLTPQQIAEDYRAWSVAALATNQFGGLAIDTKEMRTSWDLEQGEEPFARMTHEFEVTYTTKTVNAEQRA